MALRRSFASCACLLLFELFVCLPRKCTGGIVYERSDPPVFGDKEIFAGELCVNGNALITEDEAHPFVTGKIKLVQKDACGGDVNASKYRNTILLSRNVYAVCNFERYGLGRRLSRYYEVLRNSGAKALLFIADAEYERYSLPGSEYFALSSVPMPKYVDKDFHKLVILKCSYARNGSKFALGDYISNWETKASKLASANPGYEPFIKVNATRDDNPYLPVFQSSLYGLWFRGWGLIHILTFAQACAYLRGQLRANKTVPAAILGIEAVRMGVLGFHLLLGGWWRSKFWPWYFNYMFLQLLVGAAFASSLLSGLFFFDMKHHMKKVRRKTPRKSARESEKAIGRKDEIKYKRRSGIGRIKARLPSWKKYSFRKMVNSFWYRRKKIVIALCAFCFILDVTVMASLLLWLHGVVVISALFVSCLQIIVGTFYIWATSGFLCRTPTLASMRHVRPERSRYSHMAYLLSLSGVAMVAFVALAFLGGFASGRWFQGIYSPTGWALLWGSMIPTRWLISFCHIQISSGSTKRLRTYTWETFRGVLRFVSGSSTNDRDDGAPSTELVVAQPTAAAMAKEPTPKGS